MQPTVNAFRHEPSSTITYVVQDPASTSAALIDPVADFEYRAGRITHAHSERVLALIAKRGLRVEWILETHAHADHLSDAPWFRERLSAPVGIGRGIIDVQAHFKKVFHLPDAFPADGSQFDHLFDEDESFHIGGLTGRVIATPGHTSDSNSFLIGDALFVGDTLFAPDFGTARCDFPGGDAGLLYDSIQKLYALPDDTRVFLCHDYPPAHRDPVHETSIGEEKRGNKHVRADTRREEFIAMRQARDATLPMPELIIPSVQLNINTGQPLPAEADGTSFIKVPLNIFPGNPRDEASDGGRSA